MSAISDIEIQTAFSRTVRLVKLPDHRSVVEHLLLMKVCGWRLDNDRMRILIDLELYNKDKTCLTKKGKEYLWEVYNKAK